MSVRNRKTLQKFHDITQNAVKLTTGDDNTIDNLFVTHIPLSVRLSKITVDYCTPKLLSPVGGRSYGQNQNFQHLPGVVLAS